MPDVLETSPPTATSAATGGLPEAVAHVAPPALLPADPLPLVTLPAKLDEPQSVAPTASPDPAHAALVAAAIANSAAAIQQALTDATSPMTGAEIRPGGSLVEQVAESPAPSEQPAVPPPAPTASSDVRPPVAASAVVSSPAPPNTSANPNDASNTGAAQRPEIYRDRFAVNRLQILRSRGGSPETENAVGRALIWLATAQSRDGSWDADRYGAGQERLVLGHDRKGAGKNADTAMTGLALLALMGAGHTHLDGGPYAETIRRGLEYLLITQRRDGSLAGDAELFAAMYSHGIAALALSEAYALTADKRLDPGVRLAMDYTVRAQNLPTGSWRYQPNDQGDMSQLGWQLMALKSAEVAGVPTPAATRDGMIRFIRSASGGEFGGLAAYRPQERPSRTMTAEALVARQFLGMSNDNPAATEAANYLLGDLPNEKKINLYYWYYGTLGMYQVGGDAWRDWNAAMQATLLARQRTGDKLEGSWDPDCVWGGYGGRVYSTAISALCLEVYYRYLPLYQHEQRLADRAKPHANTKRPSSAGDAIRWNVRSYSRF
ncbi:MAG: squalene--hopene cyclase [Pirellulales bacterium]